MASLPSRQPQQRRTSPPQQTSSSEEPFQQSSRNDNSPPSATSVDSQTLLLNPKSSSAATADDTKSTSEAQAGNNQRDEPRKCWICFSDESEDTPDTSIWRTPCPCALTAHESCLLDWIADMEAPDSNRSTSAPADVTCPQCKSEIVLSRPRSYIVEAVSAVEKFGAHLLLPVTLSGLGYTVLLVCSHHGAHTVRMIFGPEDAEVILAPVQRWSWFEQRALEYAPWLMEPLLRGWRGVRVEVGLPLIPAALIASRTTLADAILPVLPIAFFATHRASSETLTIGYWPPSAALAMVILPYVRGIYDEYLERVWGDRVRAWTKEVQPRLGQEGGSEDHDHHHEHDEDDVIELGIEVNVIEEEDDDQAAGLGTENGATAAPGLHDPPQDGVQQDDAEQRNQNQDQDQDQNQNNGNGHRHESNILISATRIADTVLGALLYPTISAAAGELLRLLLPFSWTVPTHVQSYYGHRRIIPTGLLQTRWGRSIIGGCLFVVLKDAIKIYCKWRMAVSFRDRRVCDYDKNKGRVVK